jgi:hypothetical protein
MFLLLFFFHENKPNTPGAKCHPLSVSHKVWEEAVLKENTCFGKVYSEEVTGMFCMKCGKVIPDAARFCPYCGSQVFAVPEQQAERTCPGCGHHVAAGLLFCDQCGTKMDQVQQSRPQSWNTVQQQSWNTAQPQPRPQTERMPQQTQEVPQVQKAAEAQYGADANVYMERPRPVTVSWYRGDAKVGVAKATGLLSIYEDRLEYDKKLGSSGAAMFGLVGLAVSSSRAKKDGPVIFYLSDVASVRSSRYMGAFPSMVLRMKNGEEHSFVGTANKKELDKYVEYINSRLT